MNKPTGRTNTYIPPQQEQSEVNLRYGKLINTISGYLKGKGFHMALDALEFGKQYHTGTRKNGITPEFQHQIEIALFAQTLKEVRHEEVMFAAIFLHDVREDYNIPDKVIRERFGEHVADVVEKLSKKINGVKKSSEEYFSAIATCPTASLVKLCDRINNVSSMTGVFTIEKQKDYLEETEHYFIPLAKVCRKRFPDQSLSYYNTTTYLKMMGVTLKAVIGAEEKLNTVLLAQDVAATPPAPSARATPNKPKM